MAAAGNQKYLGESMIHVWQKSAKMPRLANRLRLGKAIDGRRHSAVQPMAGLPHRMVTRDCPDAREAPFRGQASSGGLETVPAPERAVLNDGFRGVGPAMFEPLPLYPVHRVALTVSRRLLVHPHR